MTAQLERVEQEFDTSKYHLGNLCKRGHDWNGTGMSLRYRKGCYACARLKANEWGREHTQRIRPIINPPSINPQLGDLTYARYIGLGKQKGWSKYIFAACEMCGKTRWVIWSSWNRGEDRVCKPCAYKKRIKPDPRQNERTLDGLKCPFCTVKGKFDLYQHFKFEHGLDKTKFVEMGINRKRMITYQSRKERTERITNIARDRAVHPLDRPFFLTTNYNGRNRSCVIIPDGSWLDFCPYAKITVDKKINQVRLSPVNKRVENTRVATVESTTRRQISFPFQLVEPIENGAGYMFMEGPELIIQLEGPELLPLFELWAHGKNGTTLKALYDVKTSPTTKAGLFYINPVIWPVPAEYVYLEWNNPKLVLRPVTRAGYVIKNSGLGQYIDPKDCYKLYIQSRRKRLMTRIAKFYSDNADIPDGDWLYVRTTKDGALVFNHAQNLKGRKVTPKAINPVIDHPTEPQTIKPAPQGSDFDEWLSENWQDEE